MQKQTKNREIPGKKYLKNLKKARKKIGNKTN